MLVRTIDPSNAGRLKYSEEQERHPTASIVVKQLKNIKASLQETEPITGVRDTRMVHYFILKAKYSFV